jgi:CHAT domain-containing protein
MNERLYPASTFPQGHLHLARSHYNLGSLLVVLGQAEQALPSLERALQMYVSHLEEQALTAPEAQAVELWSSLPGARNGYLTLSRQLACEPAETYQRLWHGRALLTRILQARQQVTRLALADPGASHALHQLAEQLGEVRQRLSRLSAQALVSAERDRLMRELTERKENLQRQLVQALPQGEALRREARLRPADLIERLPDGVAFLDFFRYFDGDKNKPGERYLAFVLIKGQPIRRIELGEAGPVDSQIETWLRDVSDSQDSTAPAVLSQLLWGPLAPTLPQGIHTLYLTLEGSLARLPWPALPTAPGRVLLETYRLAVVPHGPFLHEQLTRHSQQSRPTWADPRARLLAVGGVFDDLSASRREVEALKEQARPREVIVLDKASAQPERVLKELPRVQLAHLATHGFFNATLLRADQEHLQRYREKLRQGLISLEQNSSGVAQELRSPLVYTGLLLAPDPRNPGAPSQVTGEALVDLPLEGLHLCVLSACKTGLGALTGGEGVQGLQRAFHLAGCPNVVASLWEVNDEATAALMSVFYDRLWHKNEPPLEALRQAQLALYHHPERIPTLARERGPKLKEAVDLPVDRKSDEKNPQLTKTKLWAAFVLSGLGR